MSSHVNGDLKKNFEKILANFVEPSVAEKIANDVQKWLNEEIFPYLPFDVLKYKRDEHLAINTALTGNLEKKIIKAICPHVPRWMNSDVLTAIGVVGAIVASFGFYFGHSDRKLLVLVIIGLLLNWFGDSFDGSIARYWNRTRPNYGYYIDHIIDGICAFILGLGIAYSGFVRPESAYLLVIGYLLMEMHVLLVKSVENTFKYTFGLIGPTEGRILIMGVAFYMYFSDVKNFLILGKYFTQYDIAILSMVTIMAIILVVSIIQEGLKLHKQDIKKWEN
jgi:archaetidylinositol phosphate synthase